MCLRFVFLLITWVISWRRLSQREEARQTAGILILRHQLVVLCVPNTLSMSCDQVIFVDQAPNASLFSDAVLAEVGRFGQRFQRCGAVQGAVRPVLIVVGLVLVQDLP